MGGKNSYESIKRYEDKAYDKVLVRMPKGRKAEIQTFAAQTGESMNQYIISAIDQRMGKASPEVETNAAKIGDIKSSQKPAGAPQGEGAILTPAALKTAQEAAQRTGETVPAFIGRAIDTQAKRDELMQRLKTKQEEGE